MQTKKNLVLIIGSEGSMGKRYQAILKSLKVKFVRIDKALLKRDKFNDDDITHVIVATPTETHFKVIANTVLGRFKGRKVLCEKPISKDINEVKDIVKWHNQGLIDLTMVFQYLYAYMYEANSFDEKFNYEHDGVSSWNYFKSGGDGLYWDCLQIIALSGKKDPILKNKSPKWTCVINNKLLNLGDMDKAYINYVLDWLKSERSLHQDVNFLITIHQKVIDFIKRQEENKNAK